jgi:hypothetical protein
MLARLLSAYEAIITAERAVIEHLVDTLLLRA